MRSGGVRWSWWSAGRGECVGSELAQDVVAAAGELAGDGQGGAGVGEPAGFEREVVGVVGAGGLAGGLGGFIERPAQRRGALAGKSGGGGGGGWGGGGAGPGAGGPGPGGGRPGASTPPV